MPIARKLPLQPPKEIQEKGKRAVAKWVDEQMQKHQKEATAAKTQTGASFGKTPKAERSLTEKERRNIRELGKQRETEIDLENVKFKPESLKPSDIKKEAARYKKEKTIKQIKAEKQDMRTTHSMTSSEWNKAAKTANKSVGAQENQQKQAEKERLKAEKLEAKKVKLQEAKERLKEREKDKEKDLLNKR